MKKQFLSSGLHHALLKFGITEKEILTYTSLLNKGGSSVQEIFKYTGINRVSIYAAIDELKQKGLVSETRKGKKKLFIAEDPENFISLLEQQKETLRKKDESLQNMIIPMLKAINIQYENKPSIKFFEGAEGINKVYDEYILKAKSAFNCGSYETAIQVISKKAEMKFFDEIAKRKIFYRMLLEDTPLNREFAEASKGIVHTKFLSEDMIVYADIIVFEESVALFSYEKAAVTLIEDYQISHAIKTFLEFMWGKL